MKRRAFDVGAGLIAGAATFLILVGLSNIKPIAATEAAPVEREQHTVYEYLEAQYEAQAARMAQTAPAEEQQTQPEAVEVVKLYPVPLDESTQLFIIRKCEETNIEPTIILAMIDRESDFEADVIGDGGDSFGLMQIQPKWHTERMDKLGVNDLLDPEQNVAVGIDYMEEMLAKYDGNTDMALVAYNAGPTGAYEHWFSKGVYSSEYSEDVTTTAARLEEAVK